MKIKNPLIYSVISSFFLLSLISIWKILVTLQGLNLESFNAQIIFLLGFLFSLINFLLRDRLNFIIKFLIFAIIFVFIDGYLIHKLPILYNLGVVFILYFFLSKIK